MGVAKGGGSFPSSELNCVEGWTLFVLVKC